jgi:hypothetical protein
MNFSLFNIRRWRRRDGEVRRLCDVRFGDVREMKGAGGMRGAGGRMRGAGGRMRGAGGRMRGEGGAGGRMRGAEGRRDERSGREG